MKKTTFIFIFSLFVFSSFAQVCVKKNIYSVDSISIARIKELQPEISEINKYLSAKDENYTPDYSVWNEGNSRLQSFISNQDVNLWDGNYVRPTSLHSLFKEHKFRIVVNIKYPWMDSGIDLIKDKNYYLVASGLASTSNSKLALWIGPEGKEYQFNNLPMYAIIGKMGKKNKPFYIGKEIELRPQETERLFIGYNDDLFMDNIGYYIIDIFELTKTETLLKLDSLNISIGSYYAE